MEKISGLQVFKAESEVCGGQAFTLSAWVWETSRAWGHACALKNANGETVAMARRVYYNRTWEFFRFQSVGAAAFQAAKVSLLAAEMEKLREQNGGRLPRGGKEKALDALRYSVEWQEIEQARQNFYDGKAARIY